MGSSIPLIVALILLSLLLLGVVVFIIRRFRIRQWEREEAERFAREEAERRAREEAERFALSAEAEHPVRFHALWHRLIKPEVWETLLIYIYGGPSGLNGARRDFYRRMTAPSEFYDESSSTARKRLQRGTEISIYPELSGFAFNPPFNRVFWLEDWHCIEFRMRALTSRNAPFGERVDGRVAFYIGPLLIGEIDLYAIITEDTPQVPGLSELRELWEETGTSRYRAIFVSYSHKDSAIVDQLERAYLALGDDYLRDVAALRSGQAWSSALLGKIREADVFQLCWSKAAKQSSNVEQEWRYAINLSRPNFVRPMYWEVPMPQPPEELQGIHFAYVRFD